MEPLTPITLDETLTEIDRLLTTCTNGNERRASGLILGYAVAKSLKAGFAMEDILERLLELWERDDG